MINTRCSEWGSDGSRWMCVRRDEDEVSMRIVQEHVGTCIRDGSLVFQRVALLALKTQILENDTGIERVRGT